MPTGDNKRIAKNTLFLYIRMFFVLAVSLYTSRVVLRTLGISDYGVYNVVAGFVSMFGFLNVTLAASMQRFYNYEGTARGTGGYGTVYSTGLAIHLAIALALLLLMETLGLWYVNSVMVVPEGRLVAANVAYQMSALSLVLVVMEIPYSGAIMASERFDYYALVGIVEVTLRLLVVLALPFLPYDKVMAYGVLTLMVTVAQFAMFFVYAKRKVLLREEGCKPCNTVDRGLMRRMLSFSGWNLLGTFAMLLKGQGLNMLLNVFFGTVVNAARGVAYQVNAALTGFSNNVATSFQPQIVSSWAAGNRNRVESLFFAESRICFVLMAMLMTPLMLEMDYVLGLWLGDSVPPLTRVFAILVLADSLLCMFEMPCTQVALAVGRIRDYKVVPSVVGLLLLPAAWVALKLGEPPASVFVLTIVFTVFQLVACFVMLRRIFVYSYWDYARQVLLRCLLFVLLNVAVLYACEVLAQSLGSLWLRLLLVCAAEVSIGSVLAYMIVLGDNERVMVKGYCSKILRR